VKGLRIAICVLAAFAVLAFGTVEIWSEAVLEIGAAALLLWWSILVFFRREIEIRWSAIFWSIVVFIVIVVLQLLLRISVYPFLTRVGLLKFMGCVILFFLAVQAFQKRRDLKMLAWFLMSFGFVIAVFGIAQNYTSHAELYWFRPLTAGGNPFGPYVDRDHFAGLMELIAPVGLSMIAFRGVRREQMPFVGVLTLLPVAALFLAASRGGIAAFVFELALLFVLTRVHHSGRGTVALAGLLLLAVVFIAWLGAGTVLQRMRSSTFVELSASKRTSMLKGAWHIFLDHPAAGTGLGTLVAIYPKYETLYDDRIVDHVHNDYAELLAETGIAGGLCGAAFLIMLFGTAARRLSEEQSEFSRGIHAAGTVACAGLLVHSLVDFNLHIPANALFFLLNAAVVLSPTFHPRKQPVIT
jgi:O-antigen ligase